MKVYELSKGPITRTLYMRKEAAINAASEYEEQLFADGFTVTDGGTYTDGIFRTYEKDGITHNIQIIEREVIE